MSGPNQFALDVRRFAEVATRRAHLAVRKIVLDVGVRVVMRSPVGDPSTWASPAPKGYTGGHFRANWMYGLGQAPAGVTAEVDKSGRASIDRIVAGTPAQAWGHIHYIVNNLPYASRLESGWSRQAPSGMVALTVREFRGIVRRAADAVRRDK